MTLDVLTTTGLWSAVRGGLWAVLGLVGYCVLVVLCAKRACDGTPGDSALSLVSLAWACSTRDRKEELAGGMVLIEGPPAPSWLFGSLRTVLSTPSRTLQDTWTQAYGPTFQWRSIWSRPEIFTSDLRALTHMYAHSDIFDRPESSVMSFRALTGASILTADGEDHLRLRKIMVPAFGPAGVRDMMPVFLDKARAMTEKLLRLAGNEKGAEVDVVPIITQATVDVIGQAGFGLDLQALETGDGHELLQAWDKMNAGLGGRGLLSLLQMCGVPFTRSIPWTKRLRGSREAGRAMRQVAQSLITERKAMIEAESEGDVKRSDLEGKDLMTTLLRANMASDLMPSQRMSDEELASQIPLFLLAGNITSSTALSWAFLMLAKHPDMQHKLRQEILAMPIEPTSDAVNNAPYLDAFVHEILRVWSPLGLQVRQLWADASLPLGTPVKGTDGKLVDVLHLKKGTTISIPIALVNTSTEIWGPDAAEFNPDRHLQTGDSDTEVRPRAPGVWGNLMTFGGGGRGCLGFRLALSEIKTILFVVLRTCEILEIASKPTYERGPGLGVNRPVPLDESVQGIPLVIRRLE